MRMKTGTELLYGGAEGMREVHTQNNAVLTTLLLFT